ncbi:MAG: hypothetical protein HUU15_15115 [Candidatus Brocadiae bacterium]|nr:hypothetical protein [Candidatus Brocadiia bacterium]
MAISTVPLKCRIHGPPEIKAGSMLPVTFTIANPSEQDVRILNWQTPLEGSLTAGTFVITRDGAPVQYVGEMVKRGAPTPDDYVTIPAGASSGQTTDLARGYGPFLPGVHKIRFVGRLFDVATPDVLIPRTGGLQEELEIASGEMTVRVKP